MIMRKKLAFIAALIIAVSPVAASASRAEAVNSNFVSLTIDMSGEMREISPYIYGVNDFVSLDETYATSIRQGGNRYSAYNWENNYSNAGSDWYHSSDTYLSSSTTPGACAINLSQKASEYGVDYAMTTLQMLGYVSADRSGSVSEDEAAPSSRWKQVVAAKDGEFSLTPDLLDDYVYIDEYVNYLVHTLGDSSTATGIKGYNLDNEPTLWSHTHARVHPEKVTVAEIIDKTIEFGSAVKSIDSGADIFGPALFGFSSYYHFHEAPDWNQQLQSDYDWFIGYYLSQLAEHERLTGQRCLDVLDLHYYSEASGACRVTSCEDTSHTSCIEARINAARSLYDDGYTENSWIGQWFSSYLPILPLVNDSINEFYPDTKLAFTEYYFGGGGHVSGAIAQAEVLGAFADSGVYLATVWPTSDILGYTASGINLYTNYDGKGSSFGDFMLDSEYSDINSGYAFASVDSVNDDIKIVAANRDMNSPQNLTIDIENSLKEYVGGAVYGVTPDSTEIIKLDDTVTNSDGTISVAIPPMSVVQIEIYEKTDNVIGDVDLDKDVDCDDASLLSATILGQNILDSDQSQNADIDFDGIITVTDYALLKRMLLQE